MRGLGSTKNGASQNGTPHVVNVWMREKGEKGPPPNSSIFRLPEGEAGITHGVDDSQAGQFVTGLAQLSTSHLEALLNAHANAAYCAA